MSDFKNKFKEQLAEITLYLPLNTVIYIDNSTRTFLNNVSNIQNIRDHDMPKHYYRMTENGLECLDCDVDLFSETNKNNREHFNLNIAKNGVKIKVNDGNNDAEVNIDKNGIIIK